MNTYLFHKSNRIQFELIDPDPPKHNIQKESYESFFIKRLITDLVKNKKMRHSGYKTCKRVKI